MRRTGGPFGETRGGPDLEIEGMISSKSSCDPVERPRVLVVGMVGSTHMLRVLRRLGGLGWDVRIVPSQAHEADAMRAVAAERLALIGELHRVAAERLALVESLRAELREERTVRGRGLRDG